MSAVRFTDDAAAMIAAPDVEVVVEATGHAPAGIAHARRAIREGKHIVMVNVEADVLAGPLLAKEAEAAGVVYSLAYGDQPALICELVDWARPAVSRSSPPARARNICRNIMPPRLIRCGATTG